MAVAFVAAFAVFSTNVNAQTTKWKEDASHSSIGFSVKHLLVSNVKGQFNEYSVSVLSDKSDFSDAKVTVKIKAQSINTDNKQRDEHLRSPDFFEANKFPEIIFVSKKIEKTGNNTFKITGDFTMKGVTKTLTLNGELGGILQKDPWGKTKAGITLIGEVNRFDYGLNWNKAIEAGGFVVSETVKLNIELEIGKEG
ncbi:MAG: polyisoprenoid-binding protein [Ignavibacteriae bacterium]|nr:polyisoprenoid-binding protein [Ignavibacteriota bacterium]